jgi:hypothetical protein
MIIVPVGDGAADVCDVALGADDPPCGDDGLPMGVDSGTGALPQAATSRQSTTATHLTRQVWCGRSDGIEDL